MNQYDYLKDKLQDYQVKADKDKIWKGAAHAIPQRRKRRMLFLFCLGSLAGLGIVGYEISHPSSITSFTGINQQPVHASSNEYHASLAPEAADFTTTITQPANQLIHKPLIGNAASTSSTSSKQNIISNQLGKPQKTKPGIYAETNAQSSPATSNVVNNELTIASQSTVSTPLPINPADQRIVFNLTAKPGDAVDQQATGTAEVTPMAPSMANDHPRSTMDATEALPNNDEAIADKLEAVNASNPNVPIIPAKRQSKPILFSAIAAIGLSSFDVEPLNSQSDEAAALFNQSVRSLEHVSVGVAGRLPLSNVFAVETKLGWNQWTTETQQGVTTHEPILREAITEIIIDEQGTQHPVMGVVNGTQVTHTQMIRFTQFQTVTAGFSLHATVFRKHRLFVDAFAEGSLVLSNSAAGSVFNAEGVLTRFSTSGNPFKLTSAFLYGGGLQLNYQISPHLRISGSLGCQPVHYRWQQEKQQIRMTHSRIRGAVGMSYHL
jgi:hypothetical protein